jgi:hypothetical protein
MANLMTRIVNTSPTWSTRSTLVCLTPLFLVLMVNTKVNRVNISLMLPTLHCLMLNSILHIMVIKDRLINKTGRYKLFTQVSNLLAPNRIIYIFVDKESIERTLEPFF